MVERTHYLEVGGDEVPAREGRTESDGAAAVAPEVAPPFAADGAEYGSEAGSALVGIDFRGDREGSGWMSLGERLAQVFWYALAFVAIIVFFALGLFRRF